MLFVLRELRILFVVAVLVELPSPVGRKIVQEQIALRRVNHLPAVACANPIAGGASRASSSVNFRNPVPSRFTT